jgi:regulatory protein
MNESRSYQKREKRPRKPLDSTRLEELALAYVARYSTSEAKLQTYLKRKLRERGWEDEGQPDVTAISARYLELGYIDDEGFARTKSGGLLRRGYGPRRVSQALYAAGIDEPIREDVAPDEATRREAVQIMARKRRFGPYFQSDLLPDRREKQIAALLRAGHGFDHVRAVMNAGNEGAVQEWVDEAQDTQNGEF